MIPLQVIYPPVSAHTGRALARYMGARTKRELEEAPEWLIRYGCRGPVKWKPKQGVLNGMSALTQYHNRLQQLILLKAAGVSVPFFTIDPTDFDGGPVLARDFPKDGTQNTKGSGTHIYTGVPPFGHDVYMELIPKKQQFRVFVVDDKTRTRELKANAPNADPNIWVPDNGYELYKTAVPDIGLRTEAKKAVAALGLDFGAVDIASDGTKPYVLEVNTGPGLGHYSLEWMARRLAERIGMDPDTLPAWSKFASTKYPYSAKAKEDTES